MYYIIMPDRIMHFKCLNLEKYDVYVDVYLLKPSLKYPYSTMMFESYAINRETGKKVPSDKFKIPESKMALFIGQLLGQYLRISRQKGFRGEDVVREVLSIARDVAWY